MTTIRSATMADVPALHVLVEGAYRGDGARRGWSHEADLLAGQRTDAESLAGIIRDPRQRLLVAMDGGSIAGCVQVTAKGGGIACLGLLSVDPARQAGGLGRRLIAAAEALAADLFGAARMEMTVIRQRTGLIDYYGRRGYAPTSEERPFPMDDPRFGIPLRDDLAFAVLDKAIGGAAS